MASSNGTKVPVGSGVFPSKVSASTKSKQDLSDQFSQSVQITSNVGVSESKNSCKHKPASSVGVKPSSAGLSPVENDDRLTEDMSSDHEKKTSECGTGSNAKTNESAKISGRLDLVERGKSSLCRGSTSTDVSDESSCSSFSSTISKPHKGNDLRWEAIQVVRARDGLLGLSHFRLLKRLGCGDIGSVYLAELSGTKCYFAMKVMDKASLASRKKLLRAQTEREILQSLDHPFLPTLYTHFETDKFSCLVMEFCPGGDLHTLRQRQPGKFFTEQAVK